LLDEEAVAAEMVDVVGEDDVLGMATASSSSNPGQTTGV